MREPTAERSEHCRFSSGRNTLRLGAGALILYGLTRRSKMGLALAGVGTVALSAARSQPSPQQARATFLVNTTPEDAYQLWRRFENLPRFMAHLQAVRVLDDTHSEWVVRGPMEHDLRWQAEITADEPGRRIAWQSLPDADVRASGWVAFRADPQNRGCYVTAEVRYLSPAGKAGRALASLVGRHPQFMVREDLRRFKALLEAGEAPTTVGQPHGPRGIHGRTEEALFRERTNHPLPQAA